MNGVNAEDEWCGCRSGLPGARGFGVPADGGEDLGGIAGAEARGAHVLAGQVRQGVGGTYGHAEGDAGDVAGAGAVALRERDVEHLKRIGALVAVARLNGGGELKGAAKVNPVGASRIVGRSLPGQQLAGSNLEPGFGLRAGVSPPGHGALGKGLAQQAQVLVGGLLRLRPGKGLGGGLGFDGHVVEALGQAHLEVAALGELAQEEEDGAKEEEPHQEVADEPRDAVAPQHKVLKVE